ncbi:MAG: hypothetical protein IJV69_02820, partial [Kiritimatiellae bacterium]|nr:hypothetical protein [Kiritimatiellia bacterium]
HSQGSIWVRGKRVGRMLKCKMLRVPRLVAAALPSIWVAVPQGRVHSQGSIWVRGKRVGRMLKRKTLSMPRLVAAALPSIWVAVPQGRVQHYQTEKTSNL